jgi:hypothetical protein
MMRKLLLLPALLALVCTGALSPPTASACFGTELRVAIVNDSTAAKKLASFATGYFVEEKTGIAPDFIETADPVADLLAEKLDIALFPSAITPPEGLIARSAGALPGLAPAGGGGYNYWLRADTPEDLRFSTLEKALAAIHRFFSGAVYKDALKDAGDNLKKAARKAVNDAT